jgi:pimeloyl-ACP methyl ester carboxylesterase
MAEMMPGIDLDDPRVQQGMRDFAVPIGMFNEVRSVGKMAGRAAAQVNVPTLIVQGDKDPIVTPIQTGQLLRNFTEHVTYVELSAQHDLLDTTKPAWPRITVEVERFLTGLIQSDDMQ